MNTPETYVLLWSCQLNQIEVLPLDKWLSENRLAYGADVPQGDWLPLFVESSRPVLEATAAACRRTLLSRSSNRHPLALPAVPITRPVSA